MYWDGQYYYDKCLPFSLRSAPYIFNQLADAVEWILLNKCLNLICLPYPGRFFNHRTSSTLPPPPPPYSQTCQQSLTRAMLLTFRDKTQGPCTALEFMGVILDSEKMEARVPPDKVERIRTSLAFFQRRKSCTLRELQSLIVTLNFTCKVIPPGRPFLQGIIALTQKVSKAHHHISLSSGFFKDLHMWKEFISEWNGASFFLSNS